MVGPEDKETLIWHALSFNVTQQVGLVPDTLVGDARLALALLTPSRRLTYTRR
jgi:hypothetical protein